MPAQKTKKEDEAKTVYDGKAQQRFAFEITENGEKFLTAHIFEPLTDERYLQFIRESRIRQEGDEVKEDLDPATASLWRDLVVSIENADFPAGEDFRELVDPHKEIIPAMNALLPVAIWEPGAVTEGRRQLGGNTVVFTEALFSSKLVKQKHTLVRKTDEHAKLYDALLKNEIRRESTRGLRREAKVEYHPQIKARGELYDRMFVSVEGFGGSKASDVPIRFKAAVVDSLFRSGLDPKK